MTDVSGYVGNFTVKILHRPRYVDTDLCTGCGICEEKCPAKVVDEVFEAGIGYRKAIYRPFPQAVPKYPVLDPDNCIYFEQRHLQGVREALPDRARSTSTSSPRRSPSRSATSSWPPASSRSTRAGSSSTATAGCRTSSPASSSSG